MQPNKCVARLLVLFRAMDRPRPVNCGRRSARRDVSSFLFSNIWIASVSLSASVIRGSYAKRNQQPSREHLRLLLATAAESGAARNSADVDSGAVAASAEEALAAIAKSISRSPDNLLRVFDQVSAAGWDFQNIGAPAVREIIQEFR